MFLLSSVLPAVIVAGCLPTEHSVAANILTQVGFGETLFEVLILRRNTHAIVDLVSRAVELSSSPKTFKFRSSLFWDVNQR